MGLFTLLLSPKRYFKTRIEGEGIPRYAWVPIVITTGIALCGINIALVAMGLLWRLSLGPLALSLVYPVVELVIQSILAKWVFDLISLKKQSLPLSSFMSILSVGLVGFYLPLNCFFYGIASLLAVLLHARILYHLARSSFGFSQKNSIQMAILATLPLLPWAIFVLLPVWDLIVLFVHGLVELGSSVFK